VFVALTVLGFARASSAQEAPAPPDPWQGRPLSATGLLGMTPFGFAGLSATVTPLRWLSVEAGGGVALDGPQAAILPRARLFVSQKVALSLAIGPSFGRYVERHDFRGCDLVLLLPVVQGSTSGCAPRPARTWDVASWADALLAIEGRTGAGFEWRLFGGAGRLLNASASSCGPGPCASSAPVTGYGGLALGYALPL
jgi:hypothetical protein